MARHTPRVKLYLQRVTEQRDRLIVLLDDAIAIIEASDDPDCKAWLTQAHATLDQVRL